MPKSSKSASKEVKPPFQKIKGNGIVINSFPGYFLLFCIAVSAVFLYWILGPFVETLILAAIATTAFYPIYSYVLNKFKGRARLASVVSVLLVLILIIVPLFIFLMLFERQTKDTFIFIQEQLRNGILDPYLQWEKGGIIYDLLGSIREYLKGIVDVDNIDLKAGIMDGARWIVTFVTSKSADILQGFLWFLIKLLVFILAMYYFFKDSDLIVEKIQNLSPLPTAHENRLFQKFKDISLATLYGIFLTSVIQGILGGIGFYVAGVPNAVFWETAIAVFSLVPLTGAATIWFPASIFLLLIGNWFGGIALFLWGALVISTSDNVLRAVFIGSRTKMNQLITFLAVFGGVVVFQLPGVIFGPMIVNLFFAFLHIYESEYDKVLHGPEMKR